MNNQELNKAFESFNPTDEQKKRMFDNIMAQKSVSDKKTPVLMWKRIYMPACTVAAAALIFAVMSGVLAPNDVANDTYLVHNTDSTKSDTAIVSEYNGSLEEGLDTDKKEPVQTPVVSHTPKTAEVNNQPEIKNKEYVDKKFAPDTEKTVDEPDIIPGEVATFAMNINTASVPLRSRSVNMEMATAGAVSDGAELADDQAAFGGGGGSDSVTADVASTVTYGEFCSGIGFDIKNKLTLPSDMVDITDYERCLSDAYKADEWDLVYQGDDNRILTVNISRNIEQNMQYFDNESFIKTDFSGTPGVVIFDGVSYTAYINKNNIAYVVNTNIGEDELADLILGMMAD